MRLLQIFVLVFGLVVVTNGQKATLSGTVADEAGGIISKVPVVASNAEKQTYKTYTDQEGVYQLDLTVGIYQIDFVGVQGFLTTRVTNYKLAPTKMTLDIILGLDMQSKNSIYSEFICDKNGKNCRYVSRQGDGSSKPTEICVETFPTKTSKGKQN